MGYFESDALEMLEVYLLETRQLNNQLADILLLQGASRKSGIAGAGTV